MKQKQEAIFWDPSFLQEVESKAPDQGILVWSFSGPAFAIRTPQAMLYIDPFFGSETSGAASGLLRTSAVPLDPHKIRLADAVLISHAHYDHCHQDTLLPMAQGSAVEFYGPASVAGEILSYGLSQERIHEVKPGASFTVKDIRVTAYPGYDAGEPYALTYLIEAAGVKLYFAGDSMVGPAFDQVGADKSLDIAMLAFGRTWYMNEKEVLAAATRLHPKLLLPYHWDLWRGHTGDVLELGRLVERHKPPYEVQILLLGDCLRYGPDGKFGKCE